ncbi:MAG: preprotein translocase subunit SecG [Proteobacteria bacterium]|nr:preprotein translocase subunit SecG [Pseudomonadota bacterium]
MYILLLVIHITISVMLIGLILIQHGKGAQTGAAFGSGASQTVFGSQGSGGFLSRSTATLAALFFLLNLFLVYFLNKEYYPKIRQEVPATLKEGVEGKKGPTPSKEPLEKKKDSSASSNAAGTDVPEVE